MNATVGHMVQEPMGQRELHCNLYPRCPSPLS
jgi:hypothetical protein